MKKLNIRALFIIALSIVSFSACQDDIDKVSEWPEWGNPSRPAVTKAEFIPSGSSADIKAGDAVQFSTTLTDQYNELKQAEVEISLGGNVVYTKTYPLDGLEINIVSDLKIPFLKNTENNMKLAAKLKIYNETPNGFTEYTLPEALQLSVKRPQFSKLYLVDDHGVVVEMIKEPASDYAYTTAADISGVSSKIWIVEKVTAQNKPDYTGFVWGVLDDEIAIVGENEGSPITITIPEGGILTNISFNSYTFKEANLLSNSINGIELVSSSIQGYMEVSVDLVKGQDVSFLGFGSIVNKLNLDFFKNATETKATFDGESGKYKILYNLGNEFLYIEKEGAILPDAMWICGSGLGFPQAPYAATIQWNWNVPTDYIYCKKVANDIFEATVYAKDFMFKFFHQRGWGNEEDGRTYSLLPTNILVDGRNEWGDKTGDCAPGPDFTPGVYKLTIDRNAKTITMQKSN